MKIHNFMEDLVYAEIESLCADMAKDEAHSGLCTCPQCRLDAACYVLNRVRPRYFVSSRGLAREGLFSFEKQQKDTDIINLILTAFKTVAHNRRPAHDGAASSAQKSAPSGAVYNLPAIIGRILNGQNFAPLAGTSVALYYEGKLVKMNNENWENPCTLNENTEGTFTFWPAGISAAAADEKKVFELSLHASAGGFEPLQHYFEVSAVSGAAAADEISMGSTLRLPSLYMFPPENGS
jgi:competence protein ComFB